MKRIQSKAGLLKNRVNAVHSRAKSVGLTYLFAMVALAIVLTVFPLVSGIFANEKGSISVVFYYDKTRALFDLGFKTVFNSSTNIIALAKLVAYFVTLLIVYINVFRALSKLNWLYKKRASYINGFNRNMYAMDAIAKRFSSSFAAAVVFNVLSIWLTFRVKGYTVMPKISFIGYVTLGVLLFVRFVAGAAEGTVTLFTNGSKIVEKKRDHGVFLYFVRNVLQVAILGGVLYFLLCTNGFVFGLNTILSRVITGGDTMYLINVDALPTYVELVAMIFIIVMIKHATASTEYHRDCNHTLGMKNFAVFSGFLLLTCGALIAMPYFGIGLADGVKAKFNTTILWVGVLAFVGCVLDSVLRPRDKKRLEEETDEDPIPEEEETEQERPAPYGLPIQLQAPIYNNVAGTTPPVMPQPMIVPVFCGFPQGMLMPQAMIPMPAPQYLLPTPSPATAEAEAAEAAAIEPQDTTVEDTEMNPYRKYKVYCPQCGKALYARDVSPYHRCPGCDKIFQLRKFKTYSKSE